MAPSPGWGLQTEASGGHGDARGARWSLGVLSEAGEEQLPDSSLESLQNDALHNQPGARAQLALTAGTRAHSGLLSFFPDASLSGRCSPPAPQFCPVQSEALFGVSFFQPSVHLLFFLHFQQLICNVILDSLTLLHFVLMQ